MIKLLLCSVLIAITHFGFSQESNKDLLQKAEAELNLAVEKQDFEKAAILKKEIDTRNKIEEAIAKGEYENAASLKKSLEGKVEPTTVVETAELVEIKTKKIDQKEHDQKSTEAGYTGPAPGKALVELVRVTSYKYNADFPLFIGDKYIGSSWGVKAKEAAGLHGVGHIRLELEPGEHLIWTSADHHYFVQAKIEAGKTYIIFVDATLGMKKIANTNLIPINPYDEKKIIRGLKTIDYWAPQITSDEIITNTNKKYQKKGWIEKVLRKYEEGLKNESEFTKKLTPDMNIPEEFLISK